MKNIRKKYKKFLIGAILLMVIGIIVFLVKKNSDQLVYVSNWDGMENRYAICAISGWDSITRTCYGECWTEFATDMTLDEIAQTNKRDFVKDIVYGWDGIETDAKLFFHDNNYYIIYFQDYGVYCAECCYAIVDFASLNDVYFPSPAYTVISEGCAENSKKFGLNVVDELYDFCTFDEACEFYERFTNGYITIDKENQRITAPGYEIKTNILQEDFITMDWKNRTYTYTDSEGNLVVFDGK